MTIGTPHPVFAWFLDVWIFSVVLETVVKASQARVSFDANIAASIIMVMGIALFAAYHKWWSASARFLTFGEAVAGRIRNADGKVWVNPYGESRMLLYGCLWWALFVHIHIGSESPRLDATLWPNAMSNIAIDFILIAIVASSMILLGRGWSWALLGVVAFRLWNVSTVIGAVDQVFLESIVSFVPVYVETAVLVATCIAIASRYSAARRKTIATTAAAF